MKREVVLLSVVLSMVLAACAHIQKHDSETDFRWVRSDTGITITGYVGRNTDVRIPGHVERILKIV